MASLSSVASDQWGMLTAGQARRLGVSRVDLNRLVKDGHEDEPAVAQIVHDGILDGLLGRDDELEQVVAGYGIDYGYRSSTDFVTVLSGRQG